MAQTIPDIPVLSDEWVDLNQESGVPVGTALTVVNKGTPWVRLYEGDTAPPLETTDGQVLTNKPYSGSSYTFRAGGLRVWAICSSKGFGCKVSVKGVTSPLDVNIVSPSPVVVEVINSPSANSLVVSPEKQAKGDLYLDAWGIPKVSEAFSLFHGMFTYDVPLSTWKESVNNTELPTFTNASSVNGELVLQSNGVNGDIVCLDTFRSPRYQPNRGHLYSVSLFFDNPSNLGQRSCGTFTEEAGIGLRLRGDGVSWKMYVFVRTTTNAVTTDTEYEVTDLPVGYDPSKGNIYDIQAQMRMVGNFKFFIGDASTGTSKLCLTVDNLNIVDNLTVFNPALPIAYECINLGQDVTLRSGCVDVSSEGGSPEKGVYGSISVNNDSGQVPVSGFNTPIVAVQNRKTVPLSGLRNTRDLISLMITGYSDQRSVMRIWATRDETALTLNDQTWVGFRKGLVEYIVYDLPNVAIPMTFDTSKANLIFSARVDQDQSYTSPALFEGRSDIFQTAGDIFIFTIHRETGGVANVGITYEFAEEV